MLDMSVLARYKYIEYKTDKKSQKEDNIKILFTENNSAKTLTISL